MTKFNFNSQKTFRAALASWHQEYPDYDFESGISVAATDRDGGFKLVWPDFGLNYAYPVSYEEIEDTYVFDSELELSLMRAEEVASLMRRTGYWDNKQCERLCELAGLEREWRDADGESFETVLDKAAEKLQVEIYR